MTLQLIFLNQNRIYDASKVFPLANIIWRTMETPLGEYNLYFWKIQPSATNSEICYHTFPIFSPNYKKNWFLFSKIPFHIPWIKQFFVHFFRRLKKFTSTLKYKPNLCSIVRLFFPSRHWNWNYFTYFFILLSYRKLSLNFFVLQIKP